MKVKEHHLPQADTLRRDRKKESWKVTEKQPFEVMKYNLDKNETRLLKVCF